jgi:hypothetical protein
MTVAVIQRETRLDESTGDITGVGCELLMVGQRVAVGVEQVGDCAD